MPRHTMQGAILRIVRYNADFIYATTHYIALFYIVVTTQTLTESNLQPQSLRKLQWNMMTFQE